MTAISAVFTIGHVANLLGEDEDWLFELSIGMEPEDGSLWVYGVGEDGVPAFTLAHNVASREEVDSVLEDARRAGAEVGAAEQRDWGGYTGYFADPDHVRWEIAWNPGPIGRLVLPEAGQ